MYKEEGREERKEEERKREGVSWKAHYRVELTVSDAQKPFEFRSGGG